MPDELNAVTALGVPCPGGKLIYRNGEAGHTVEWSREPGEHWAAGIIAICPTGGAGTCASK